MILGFPKSLSYKDFMINLGQTDLPKSVLTLS